MLILLQSVKLPLVDSLCAMNYLIKAVHMYVPTELLLIVLNYKRLVVVYTNTYPHYRSILVDVRPYDVQIRALTHQVVH